MNSAWTPARRLRFAITAYRSLWRQDVSGLLFRIRMFTNGVVVERGCRANINGTAKIESGVILQRGLAIGIKAGGKLEIGSGTRIGADAVIGCSRSVRLGRDVLIAARCYIADFGHAFENPNEPVTQQGSTVPESVSIGNGSWLGINVTILPGVDLGANCVVAANSVVTRSFEDGSIVAGAPAKLIRFKTQTAKDIPAR